MPGRPDVAATASRGRGPAAVDTAGNAALGGGAAIRGGPSVILLAGGWEASAWFGQTFLPRGEELRSSSPSTSFHDGWLMQAHRSYVRPVDVVYARMGVGTQMPSDGHDGGALRADLLAAVRVVERNWRGHFALRACGG